MHRDAVPEAMDDGSPPSPTSGDTETYFAEEEEEGTEDAPTILDTSEQERLLLQIRRQVASDERQHRRMFKLLVFAVWFVNIYGLLGYFLFRGHWHDWLHSPSSSSVSVLSSLSYYTLSFAAFWRSASVVGTGRGQTRTSQSRHSSNQKAMWLLSFLAFASAAVVVLPAARAGAGLERGGMGEPGGGGTVKALLGTDSVYLIFMMFGNLLLSLVCHQVDKSCDASWKEVEDLEGLKYNHKKV